MENEENKEVESNIGENFKKDEKSIAEGSSKEGKKDNQKFIAHAIIVAGVLIAGAILIKGTSAPTPLPGGGDGEATLAGIEINPLGEDDHILGNPAAEIAVIEYSDTECPFCKTFHETMHRVVAEKEGQVAWVYRHYPVPELHAKAVNEALATECAWEQGGNDVFWQYIDEVFTRTESNDSLPSEALPAIAADLSLNIETFNACLGSEKYLGKIEASKEEGNLLGMKIFGRGGLGTPTSIITKNGEVVDVIVGAQSYQTVLSAISKHE